MHETLTPGGHEAIGLEATTVFVLLPDFKDVKEVITTTAGARG